MCEDFVQLCCTLTQLLTCLILPQNTQTVRLLKTYIQPVDSLFLKKDKPYFCIKGTVFVTMTDDLKTVEKEVGRGAE